MAESFEKRQRQRRQQERRQEKALRKRERAADPTLKPTFDAILESDPQVTELDRDPAPGTVPGQSNNTRRDD
jgi:hypothetical protein